jgi:hypothetical protein
MLVVTLALAACAGSVTPAAAPGGSAPVTAPPASAIPAANVPGAPPSSASGAAPQSPPPVAGTASEAVEMKAPVPTAFVDGLRTLGVDLAHPPRIEQLDARALREVMKLFTRSLGVRCYDCHEQADFSQPTRRKKIAARMWNEFVARLELRSGAPLFCDSCHQGRVKQLDRRDKKALGRWMDDHFVAELARSDGGTHNCETCHVDWEMHLLDTWSR